MNADILAIFLTMFILIDPLGVSVVYLSLVNNAGLDTSQRRQVALRAPLIALIVLTLFVFFGTQLISALGILPGSLYIAGGILLFFIAMDLLFAKPKRTTRANRKEEEEFDGMEIAIFPLALPLLSGPGAITAILIFTSEQGGALSFSFLLLGIIALVLALAWLFMFSGNLILRILHRTGVTVIERIMGILLAGMSVQFVYDGLVRLGVLSSGG
jgi:multiple antibiotic resistance protein